MSKPTLLLDVDGVMNVIDSTCPSRKVTLSFKPGETSTPGLTSISFFPVSNAPKLLKLAWELFDVTWLTAWLGEANAIARWAGLEERPFLDGRSGCGSSDWKFNAVSKARNLPKRVAWIEDGISPEAKELVARRGWLYLHCEPFVGVTDEHLVQLERFAREIK